MPIQCVFNAHCRVITTTVQPVFSLALVWHFGLPFLIPFGEFLLRVLMGFSRHGFCTYCVVHVVVHGAFTGSCFVERGSPCWDLPMEWGEDVGGRLRDSDAGYVEECWGLLGCFEGDESA